LRGCGEPLHSRTPAPKSVNHRRGFSDRQTASADFNPSIPHSSFQGEVDEA
jgi:hypothetical protein